MSRAPTLDVLPDRRAPALAAALLVALTAALGVVRPTLAADPRLGSGVEHTPPHVTRWSIDDPPSRGWRSAPPRAPAPPSITAEHAADFERALDAGRIAAGVYGATFAVVRDGHVVWTGASGVARDAVTPLTPEQPLVIGSVTKTFVAALILELAEEGRLRLDEPVASVLPDAPGPATRPTIRQLLNHTAGLADVYNETTKAVLEGAPERVMTRDEVLAAWPGVWFEPGADWGYSNANYLVLAMIAERLEQAALEEAITRRFAGPMHLASVRVLDATDPEPGLSPAWRSVFWGSGAMAANAADLARWGDALYGGGFLESDTLAAMLAFNDHEHGLGVQRMTFGEHVGYGHSGLLGTTTSLLLHLPEADLTIAVLTNRSEVDLYGMLTLMAGGAPSLLDLAMRPPGS
jgi:D-alanyl-D-alanine carboxypeptidase